MKMNQLMLRIGARIRNIKRSMFPGREVQRSSCILLKKGLALSGFKTHRQYPARVLALPLPYNGIG